MNPYGIQQVDVPGLLAVYQSAQNNRAQQMLAKREMEMKEKQADRDQRFSEILAKGMGGQPPAPVAAYQGAPQGGPVEAYQGGVPAAAQPTAPAAPPAARPNNFQLPPETMAQLIALDVDEAGKVIQAFSQMNEAQHKASQNANETLGRAAQYLLGVPEAERAAEIQRIAPELMSHGISQEQVMGFQPTTRNLEYMVAQSRDIEKLREEAQPKLRNVQAGDMIIDERKIGEPGSPTVYESPYIKGPDGVIYEKESQAGGQGQSPEQLRAAADEAIRKGADPAAVNARLQQMLGGGGGGNATGGFQ